MYNRFRTYFIYLNALIFTLTLTGCASIYGNSSHSFFTPEIQSSSPGQNKVNVTVTANAWSGTPENLSGYINPLYIEITNNTQSPLSIVYNDFVIIDEYRNQYNVLVPEIASVIIAQKSKRKWYFRPSI